MVEKDDVLAYFICLNHSIYTVPLRSCRVINLIYPGKYVFNKLLL